MPPKKDLDTLALTVGATGYAITMAMLDRMEDKGAPNEEIIALMQSALRKLELLHRTMPHQAFAAAALGLRGQIEQRTSGHRRPN